jgi:hypothetical protein
MRLRSLGTARQATDTMTNFYFLPTLRAQASLNAKETQQAIEALQATGPYELVGESDFAIGYTSLYPIYLRGQAYVTARSGKEAAVEFQKILDHRGIVVNGPVGALAHLGLARVYVLQDDRTKARAKYQDFLTLWKDSDPGIPILKAAKAEYEKLQWGVYAGSLNGFISI